MSIINDIENISLFQVLDSGTINKSFNESHIDAIKQICSDVWETNSAIVYSVERPDFELEICIEKPTLNRFFSLNIYTPSERCLRDIIDKYCVLADIYTSQEEIIALLANHINVHLIAHSKLPKIDQIKIILDSSDESRELIKRISQFDSEKIMLASLCV